MLPLLGLTLFVSAFLLFCCEPMVGKMVMPILGGAASVWTTCVLFFQVMLLVGYVYAHLLGKLKRLRDQIFIHLGLMLIALAFLPIRFGIVSGRPSDSPVLWLLGHLLIAIGVPFAVISATAPLLQSWLARTPSAFGRDPYFLYAASNFGSLLALIAYPIFFEPGYGVSEQSRLWLQSYGLLLAMVALAGVFIAKESRYGGADSAVDDLAIPPTWKTRGKWLAASFVPSALMLAVTNHISLDIGSVPFLWVIPLAVYLLTLIMAFARRIRVSTAIISSVCTLVLLVLFPVAAVTISVPEVLKLMTEHVAILFFGALLCHSSLADSRPSTRYLTEFYFIVALGGVLGGIFTAIVAPAIFDTVFEYPLLVATLAFFREPNSTDQRATAKDALSVTLFALLVAGAWYVMVRWAHIDVSDFSLTWNALKTNANIAVAVTEVVLILSALLLRKRLVAFGLAFATLMISFAVILPLQFDGQFEGAMRLFVARNFFGVKKVLFDPYSNMRKLFHGDTMHGLEGFDSALVGQPLAYYHRTGPAGDVMQLVSERPQQHVGVVGLGTGAIAAYGGPARHITFFDVDPQVAHIANEFFTFIKRCGANCDIVIGDGRLSMQTEPEHEFDVIILDAFNSDSIPAHLISREAVRMYMSKLKAHGILLFHVSSRYLDVVRLATAVSIDEGLTAFIRRDVDDFVNGKVASVFVMSVLDPADVNSIPNKDGWKVGPKPTDFKSWTDDYSNMMSVIRWPREVPR